MTSDMWGASSAKGVVSILIGDEPATLIEQLTDNFPDAALRAVDDDRLVDRWSQPGLSLGRRASLLKREAPIRPA